MPATSSAEQALEALRKELAKVPAVRRKLGESAQTLCAYLQLQDRVDRMLSDLAEYAQRRTDEDTRVAAYQAMSDRILSVWVEASAASSFETPEVLAIEDAVLEQFYRDEPALELYRRVSGEPPQPPGSYSLCGGRKAAGRYRRDGPDRPTRHSPCSVMPI